MVPQLIDTREEILRESHYSRFAVHLGGTKISLSLVLLGRDEETCRGLCLSHPQPPPRQMKGA